MDYKIFGTPGCKYCVLAYDLLTSKGFTVDYVNLLEDNEAADAFVERQFKTVPQIYIRDEDKPDGWSHIGGYTEVKERLNET